MTEPTNPLLEAPAKAPPPAAAVRNDQDVYDGPSVELPTALVTIKKRTNAIPREVPHHEVPVLRAMHGADSVEVKDAAYGTVVLPDDPTLELARLKNKYDRPNSQVVLGVYGNPSAVAAVTGMDLMASEGGLLDLGTNQQKASVVIDPKAGERKKAAQKAIASTRARQADKKKKA